jgi:hypothetical protein
MTASRPIFTCANTPVYIVLNMVRAGVVRHPSGWACGG